MRQHYPGRGTLLSLLAFSSLIPAFAGNIPQYAVAKGDASAKYAEFTDGTAIPCPWTAGIYALLPDGKTTPNVITAQGFPIGFDFRFGGTTVNQFIPSNTGDIYLGKDAVTYGNGCFCISMSPVKHGLKAGQISYKMTGNEGGRVLVIQWKNATINSDSGYVGKYSVQFRLYEADGKIEVAFKEIETPDTNNGFDTSIHGWDGRDAVLLTATGLDGQISVSPNFKTDMLTPSSYIKWDADDYDQGYAPVFVFTPESNKTAPKSAPADLNVVQNGNDMEISCKKGADAAATVVLISEQPFTDADMPVDGETFRAAYLDSNGKQWFPTQLGNAKPLTYINDSEISTIYKGIDAGKTYYIRAISTNGYPAYNRSNITEVVFSASQAAPTSFTAKAADSKTILLNVEAENSVIIAATTEREPGYAKGYNGLFGTPAANANVGDEIEGGGKVIYVGDPGNVRAETEPNAMTYFRAWTVKDGRVSSTTADCAAAPNVSFPFEPAIEDYPQGESLLGWETLPFGTAAFIPQSRNEGTENVVKAISANGERMILKTPDLPLDRPMKVSFEWAMETVRPPETTGDSGGIALPKGNKPGEFGSGSLDLSLNGTVHRSVNKYEGTMKIFSGDEYVEGSSTFMPFEAEIPSGEGTGKLEISFAGDVANTSILYLRNIRVEATGEAPAAPSEAPTALAVDEDRDGFLHVSCQKGSDAAYTLVLISEKPITASDIPADGTTAAVGSKSGNASVLYWGTDENIVCATTSDILVSDFDKNYYVVAVSASKAPLYNREKIAQKEYRTLPDFGAPVDLAATFDTENNIINITAKRHENAASTLILVSDAAFDSTPEDGQKYAIGDALGNAKVAYNGEDAEISTQHVLTVVPENVTVTAYSRNPKGWYSTQSSRVEIPTKISGIESVESVPDIDKAEIYNVAGIRLHVSAPAELPAGIYIINGKKVIIK